jgi:flagellar biosynthesis protein FlhG
MPLTPELRHLARELLLAAPPGAAMDAASDATPLRPARVMSSPFHAAH